MVELLRIARYGIRSLYKNLTNSVVAVATLAIGIGACTVVFSIVDAILFRPLPFSSEKRLVRIFQTHLEKGYSELNASPGNFIDWQNRADSFSHIGAVELITFNVNDGEFPRRVAGALVTSHLLPLLGVTPMLGRGFVLSDVSAPVQEVLLSYGFWKRFFSSNPDAVGRSIRLNKQLYTIVGVMPQDFVFPHRGVELWTPMSLETSLEDRGTGPLMVFGRLEPDTSIEKARSEMDAIASSLADEYPELNKSLGVRLVPLRESLSNHFEIVQQALHVLLGAVFFVLLIACSNVANLLVASTQRRRKEIAIRFSLGASRRHIVVQLLCESLLLAAAGGALGLVLSLAGVKLMSSVIPSEIYYCGEIDVNLRVLIFTLVVSLLTLLLFGLWPALKGSRIDLNESLKESSGHATAGTEGRRSRRFLVVVEICLAMVLLCCTGLTIQSFLRMQQVDPGFDPERVSKFETDLNSNDYAEEHQTVLFYRELLERLRSIPGVQSAAVVSGLPLLLSMITNYTVDGDETTSPESERKAIYRSVSSDYFDVMGIPILEGNTFAPIHGRDKEAVVIISQTLAHQYWPEGEAVGKRLSIGCLKCQGENPWRTVVGVVGSVRSLGLSEKFLPEIYLPFEQKPFNWMTLVVKARSQPNVLFPRFRQAALEVDKNQVIFGIETMDQVIAGWLDGWGVFTGVLIVFSACALFLAMIGIYSLMEYLVRLRDQELAIRIAVGAGPSDIKRLLIGEGMGLSLVGVFFGLLLALLAAKALQSLLYGVSAYDLVNIVLTIMILLSVSLFAIYWPARRATKRDPVVLLRDT